MALLSKPLDSPELLFQTIEKNIVFPLTKLGSLFLFKRFTDIWQNLSLRFRALTELFAWIVLNF